MVGSKRSGLMVNFQDGRKSGVEFQKDLCWDKNYAKSLSLHINDLEKGVHSEISKFVDDANSFG